MPIMINTGDPGNESMKPDNVVRRIIQIHAQSGEVVLMSQWNIHESGTETIFYSVIDLSPGNFRRWYYGTDLAEAKRSFTIHTK